MSLSCRQTRLRSAPGRAGAPARRAALVVGGLLFLAALAGVAPAFAARVLVPDTPAHGSPHPSVGIGDPGDFKEYFRIDQPAPITIEGPGMMRFYVRAHIAPSGAQPDSVHVTIRGLKGFPAQHFWREVDRSRGSDYADGRPGGVTRGEKIEMAIPRGIHTIVVSGESDVAAEAVFARFYYDGPPTPAEERKIDFDYLLPQFRRKGWPSDPVELGRDTRFSDYYRIDQGCPLEVEGPGTLRFFARAHIAPDGPTPRDLTISITGLEGFGEQRWEEGLKRSKTWRYGDERPGGLTGGEKILLSIPPGKHHVTVTGTTETGGPVYARFYHQPPPKKESPWTIDADFALDLIYDDNIGRYSHFSLEEFRSNERPDRYAIQSEDDWIVNPEISFELRHANLFFGNRSRYRIRYRLWEYMRNSIKTNDEVNFRFRQDFRESDYLEFTYTYAPDSYIKELWDRPPYVSGNVEGAYLHFLITRNDFDLGYRYYVNDWLRLGLFVGRTLRFYNRPFLENDLWEWNGKLDVDIEYGRFSFSPQYTYQNVEARAYDQVDETHDLSDNDSDGSYEEDDYRLYIYYEPKRSPYRPGEPGDGFIRRLSGWGLQALSLIDQGLVKLKTDQVVLRLNYDRRFYTSERPLYVDPLHAGRMDTKEQVTFEWHSRALYQGVSLELGARYTDRSASGPAVLIGEDDPSEEKDYIGTRYWVAFSRDLY